MNKFTYQERAAFLHCIAILMFDHDIHAEEATSSKYFHDRVERIKRSLPGTGTVKAGEIAQMSLLESIGAEDGE